MQNLSEYLETRGATAIASLPQPALIDLQEALQGLGLYSIPVDGIFGKATATAFAEFKEQSWFDQPELIGLGTLEALLEESSRHAVPDEATENQNQSILVDAGQKSGKQINLPRLGLTYVNEYIVPGIPLTWGEMTANGERVPKTIQLIKNAESFARKFGWVRDKYGSALAITSGYRPPDVNRRVGGATRSRHLFFQAADLYPLDGNLARLLEILVSSAFGGIGDGRYRGFCHADDRGYRVRFGY